MPLKNKININFRSWDYYRILTVALLIAVYAFGVGLRTASYLARGKTNNEQYWVESAQHFRNVENTVKTGTVPRIDIPLEFPDGLNTRTHTFLGEYFIGKFFGLVNWKGLRNYLYTHTLFGQSLEGVGKYLFPMEDPILSVYSRYAVRWSMCLIIIPMYLIVSRLTGLRWAGLLASLLYASSYGAIDRSLGDTLYHEHVALPFLVFHIYFFVLSINNEISRKKWIISALLSWGCLFMALQVWKVIGFYYIIWIGYFAFIWLMGQGTKRIYGTLLLHTILTAIVSMSFENHLYYDRFILSPAMLLAYAILLLHYISLFFAKETDPALIKQYFIRFILIAIVFVVMISIAPKAERYGHVWETFFARLRYWQKPLDPSKISFDARHYWVPPYTSPTLFDLIYNFGLYLIAGIFPLVIFLSGWIKNIKTPFCWKEKLSTEKLFLAFMAGAFFSLYLIFFKLESYFSIFAIPWVILLVTVSRKKIHRILIVALILLISTVQTYQAIAWTHSVIGIGLYKAGIRPSTIKQYTKVTSAAAIEDLLEWVGTQTKRDEAFLCEFVLSPSILEYAERPVNQHCFFESSMREKYRLFVEGIFKDEESFYKFCMKYKTRYFIYNAHILFRTDPQMSFRYSADEMKFSKDWVAYQFNFEPDSLKHFSLVYQNHFFRVYRVLWEDEEPPVKEQLSYEPFFDESIFKRYVSYLDDGEPDTSKYFYDMMNGLNYYDTAVRILQMNQDANGPAALEYLKYAENECKYIPQVFILKAQIYERLGDKVHAVKDAEWALTLRPDDPFARILYESNK